MIKEAFLLFVGITLFIKNKMTVCVVDIFQADDGQRNLPTLHGYYLVCQEQHDGLYGVSFSGLW